MARGELLFVQYELSFALPEQEKKAKDAVERIDVNAFLNSNQDDLCDELAREFTINVPLLKEDATELDQQETRIDVSQDQMRMIFDRSQPFYMKGTEITFFVPYEGDGNLFGFRPNSFTLNPPRAQVNQGELAFTYSRLDHDAGAVKREFQSDLESIQSYLQTQRNQVKQYNETIRLKIHGWITERRERLLKSQGMVAALGYPMRRRPDAPTTYIAPTIRKKPTIARPAAASKPFKPEPVLDLAEYEHIISVISNMVAVMERSPQAFRGMKEEDLRQHFLVQLNGQYEGQATGETFNFDGKTDILIRVEGKNIFISECKFWNGPESFNKALDQLLGYASWRDTKIALLIFNRDRNLTTVLQKIPELVKSHQNFRKQLEYKSESGFRFLLHHKDDKARDLILTVAVFEVPA
jgi:hypothetical protein